MLNRWSAKGFDKAARKKPLKWFYFYTYVRFPLSILVIVGVLAQQREVPVIFAGAGIIVVYVATMIGLSTFRSWALNLNILLLLMDCYLWFSRTAFGQNVYFSKGDQVVLFGLILLLWFVPNLIYFEKRRILFGSAERLDHVGPKAEANAITKPHDDGGMSD